MSITITADSVAQIHELLNMKRAGPIERFLRTNTEPLKAGQPVYFDPEIGLTGSPKPFAVYERLIEKMFETMLGCTPEQLVIGRNVPMCIEVDAIKLMEHFGESCPKWLEVAKKYRELRAQPTSLYAGKAVE